MKAFSGFVLLASASICLNSDGVTGMTASNQPFVVEQCGGTKITVRLVGGEDDYYVEDMKGFTVLEDPRGCYVYAMQSSRSGDLFPTGLLAGKEDPAALNITKRVRRTDKAVKDKLNREHRKGSSIEAEKEMKQFFRVWQTKRKNESYNRGNYSDADLRRQLASTSGVPRRLAKTTGNVKNLVVPCRFSDHRSRSLPSVSELNVIFNNRGKHSLAPTGSVRDHFLVSSYDKLNLQSTVANWVTLPSTESFYANGNSGLTTRSHQLIGDCLTNLQKTRQINFKSFDGDNDGYIDAITFLHSGYAAEFGGSSMSGRIWSHKWSVYSLPLGEWRSNDGVAVYDYHISPALWGTSGSAIGRIGVIAHETGHFFGLGDMYDTDSSEGNGIGSFGLMGNSWGFDGDQLHPPIMSPHSKKALGWLNPREVTESGKYSLRRSYDNGDCIMIKKNFQTNEYLLIENRQKIGFETAMPNSGLLIWHIDENASYNTEGYPGLSGFPTNGKHYKNALLAADGNYDLERGNNQGDGADFFSSTGRSSLVPSSKWPNTASYQGGRIVDTKIYITDISKSGTTMTFNVGFGKKYTGGSDATPTPKPTPKPTAKPTKKPTQKPTAKPTPKPTSPPNQVFKCNTLKVLLVTDENPRSISWLVQEVTDLDTGAAKVIMKKSAGSMDVATTLYKTKFPIKQNRHFVFSVTDKEGNGLAPKGSFTIKCKGKVVLSGAEFKTNKRFPFKIGKPPRRCMFKKESCSPNKKCCDGLTCISGTCERG